MTAVAQDAACAALRRSPLGGRRVKSEKTSKGASATTATRAGQLGEAFAAKKTRAAAPAMLTMEAGWPRGISTIPSISAATTAAAAATSRAKGRSPIQSSTRTRGRRTSAEAIRRMRFLFLLAMDASVPFGILTALLARHTESPLAHPELEE